MKNMTKIMAVGVATSIVSLASANAQITAVEIGTANPPTTLGGYTMVADGADIANISGADYDAYIGSGWATWGQGYTGQVAVSFAASSLVIECSATSAIYFYEEPNQFSNFYMTATDNTGQTVTTLVNGYAGSSGVGFYSTVPGTYVQEIAITCTDPTGFAIGEFGVNSGGSFSGTIGAVPEPTSLATIGLGAALLGLRRRNK